MFSLALNLLSENGNAAFKHMTKMGDGLVEALENAIKRTGFQAMVQGLGACGCQLYMTSRSRIDNYREFQCDTNKYRQFHKHLLKNGVFVHPAQVEHMFVSTAHTEQDIRKAEVAATEALKQLK